MKISLKLALLLLVAFVLRLISVNQSLWLDEAIGANLVKNETINRVLLHFPLHDNHPPLYYLILKLWTGLFGYSELSIRLPSIIFGVLTVYITYLIAGKFIKHSKSIFPIFSAFLIATSQFHIYYSQEARMYSQTSFFAATTIYFLLVIGQVKDNLKYWIFFSLSLLMLVFSDYVPVFIIPVFWLYGLVTKKDKSWWIGLLISHIPLVVVGLLWLPIFRAQLAGGKWVLENLPAWRELAGGSTFKQLLLVWTKFTLGRISFYNKIFYYTLILVSSVPFGCALINSLRRAGSFFLIHLWFFVPLTLTFVFSFFIPAFIYFRFMFIVPAFYLLIAWGTSSLINLKVRNLLIAIFVIVNAFSLVVYYSDNKQKREDWKNTLAYLNHTVKNDEIVLFSNPESFAPFTWYKNAAINSGGATNSVSINDEETRFKTELLIKNRNGVYYFNYLQDLIDPRGIVRDVIAVNNYKKDSIFVFNGVGEIEYWVKE
ncbi:hypothetical protein A3A76_03615 [Candidatus Woesebacteria bacterium RIFCSPLOWO2_01_FULL_39_23]|uniref:Glycosyltransferase RgtA/B/C/D-like domain-containing protein n=1 Tax=Candidatus Woesebacteria bacterium RIFCSPHIGHO2_01_FULL_40_22 TaxID=1802499 RepID=A0A1F7YJU3_9BACT|nr:MAG: hypothetical protein A2141_00410 [Candidatus Woesebacteria bacterium RBG_16_40_11]OGM27542.1 MAG: hypothetical protein A2628_02015 [Candidatus Woesebacteria bacterium RIFCSPHIGHO2_01_FULL_40_22]OGM36134.1 MAG: hypothetical protein A3E41_02255 [Candidatus Woesebacteria bacterium RIFCSPHIGHO2_12_FULL_38_9]OGM62716.1 MAG: hypothetical protein A3A76_03615 [Candidatus Woesebacteria bacterium RIFCSPLOWO2_01_FULL_39_23]